MVPTVFGALVAGIAPLLLMFGTIEMLLLFVLSLTLLGGASAITLTALGGSSIMPANLAICFLILRFGLPGPQQYSNLGDALRANAVLLLFVTYGVLGAYILPKIFANAMNVTPLHPHATADPFASEPLKFTNQNITNSVYFLQTMFAAVGAFVVARRHFAPDLPSARRSLARLAIAAAIMGATHATLGVLSVVAKDRLGGFFTFFRNGSYAQLNQQVGEISRMDGIFPEPSNYCAYGFAWLVFLTELWLRHVCPRWTGLAAALLLAALLGSTSSTAYVGLLAYGLVLGPRVFLGQGAIAARKGVLLLAGGLAGLAAVLALALFLPAVGAKLGKLLANATFDKTQSLSALQRGFWAKQGLDAFLVSKGLGIGCGSFRSSSLITAIMGCLGVVGVVTFPLYLVRVFMPLRRSTWVCQTNMAYATGAAASWAAVLMLAPLSLTAPSPDPGILWGIFCGLALALRRTEPVVTPPHRTRHFHQAVIPIDDGSDGESLELGTAVG